MSEIKLIILDADGVLTNGQIGYDSDLKEIKFFNAKDGFAIKYFSKFADIKFAIITGGSGSMVKKRAEILDIEYVVSGCFEKEEQLFKLRDELNLTNEEIAYMGDDWFDWPAMKHAGFKGVPNDGTFEIKERADFVSSKNGGNGAVREFIEAILKRDGKFEEAKSQYF